MKSEWENKPITEIVDFNPKYTVKKGSNIKYVEMAAVPEHNREISYFQTREFKSGSKFKNGDTLFSRITPCLQNGKISKVSGLRENEIANGSTEFIVLSAKDKANDTDFVYYLTLDKEFRKYAEGRMEGTTGRQRVSWQALSEYELPIPPKNIRKKIAHILSTLDDKIELNRKMNQTLEDMAQALFKSWFVDFDPVKAKAKCSSDEELEVVAKELGISKEILELFPSEFEDSELGMIPKGWRVSTIEKEVNIYGGATPSTKEDKYWNGGNNNWATPRDLSGLNSKVLITTGRKITKEGVNKISSRQLPIGTILLSSRAPVGYIAYSTIPISINQGFIAMVCDKQLSNYFIMYWLDIAMNEIKNRSIGTTFSEISKSAFRPIKLVVPDIEILTKFNTLVSPIVNKIISNEQEIQTLQKTRDTLLPKLLSGEIEV